MALPPPRVRPVAAFGPITATVRTLVREGEDVALVACQDEAGGRSRAQLGSDLLVGPRRDGRDSGCHAGQRTHTRSETQQAQHLVVD